MKRAMLCLVVVSLSVLALPGAQPVLSVSAGAKVSANVYAALQDGGKARVVIALQEPPAMHSTPLDLDKLKKEIAESQKRVRQAVEPVGFEVIHQYEAVPAFAGMASQETVATLENHPDVRRVDLDPGGSGTLGTSVPLIRANQMHAQGFTGVGVQVAILDTGLDTDHADLGDDLIAEACFVDDDGMIDGSGRCPNGSDRQSGAGAAESGVNHGVQTTGIVTSRGTVSSVGVAPDAEIVAIKVLDNTPPAGVFFFFSEIVAALNFIIGSRPDVDVINMSLGTSALFTGDCDNATAFNMAGAAAISTLRSMGITAFASSGNSGSGTQMGSPACLSNVLSVGATDSADNVAGFTNVSTTLDIMAPGVSINSTGLANGTASGNGTSFASPHAAGCAALLIQSGIATTPGQIEAFLESSPIQVSTNGLSFPRIDCFGVPPAPPTAVRVVDFGAVADRTGKVHLSWRTGSEAGVLGFHLLRSDESTGRYVAVNRRLIAGQGSAAQGGHYRWFDAPGVGTFSYRLTVIHDGEEPLVFGPAMVRVDTMGVFLPLLRHSPPPSR